VFPSSVAAVLGFLLAVAPGLLFETVRERRRPATERSAFREASDAALASLLCGAVALAVLWGIRSAWPHVLPDPRMWLLHGTRYVADHVREVATFFAGWVLVAGGVAYVGAWAFSRKALARINPNTTGWFEVFRRQKPDGRVAMALVKLED
jgi:hypothetical protein